MTKKRIKGILIIFPVLTIALGIATMYHGFSVLSNWDNSITPNINTLMLLMMSSVSFSVISLYIQRQRVTEVDLMNKLNKEKEKWKTQKAMGKSKYILIHGILLWGVCFSIIYGTLTMFVNPNKVNYDSSQIITRFIAYAIISGLVGIIISTLQWNINKKRFDKLP